MIRDFCFTRNRFFTIRLSLMRQVHQAVAELGNSPWVVHYVKVFFLGNATCKKFIKYAPWINIFYLWMKLEFFEVMEGYFNSYGGYSRVVMSRGVRFMFEYSKLWVFSNLWINMKKKIDFIEALYRLVFCSSPPCLAVSVGLVWTLVQFFGKWSFLNFEYQPLLLLIYWVVLLTFSYSFPVVVLVDFTPKKWHRA